MYNRAVRQQAFDLRSRGLSTSEIHRELGVSRAAITVWLRDRSTALSVRPGCFVCSDVPLTVPDQYVYLLGQYLGDGCVTTYHRVPKLRIACADAYPGIRTLVSKAVSSVSGNSVMTVQKIGCSELAAYWNHWPCLFPQHGPGRKHERPIVLERWQRDLVADHPWDLLRGLTHSDGCRSLNTIWRGDKAYAYPRYFFSNESTDIIGVFTDALDQIGVRWRMCRPNLVAVSRRADVALMDDHIGPKR